MFLWFLWFLEGFWNALEVFGGFRMFSVSSYSFGRILEVHGGGVVCVCIILLHEQL